MKRIVFCLSVLLLSFNSFVMLDAAPLSPSNTQALIKNISDDSELRSYLSDTVFRYNKEQAANIKRTIYTLPTGESVELRTESNDNVYSFVLARRISGSYPGWAGGSWILTKSKADNSFVRIRVFLRSDPFAYIDFRPRDNENILSDNDIFAISNTNTMQNENNVRETLGIPFPQAPDIVSLNTIHGSLLDIVLYDAYITRGLPVPFSFEQLLREPLSNVIESLGDNFPRRYFEIETNHYRDIVNFIPKLRASLKTIRFADDGAIDENGDYVFIKSLQKQKPDGKQGLNCSGFAKFVADGILLPLTGKRLPLKPLKEKRDDRGSTYTNVYEDTLDPFFGLDWSRNLGAAVNSAFKGNAFSSVEEFEVRQSPSSEVRQRNAGETTVRTFPPYILDAGFSFDGLQALLYTLAVDKPGKIYIADVNNESGERASVRRHFHLAVLIPYFDAKGTFHILCFESAEETAFYRFQTRYPGHLVNLIGIPVEGNFEY